MTADLRAGIEALVARNQRGKMLIDTWVPATQVLALLAAHPVQDEDVRSAVSVWLTLALDIRSDGPSVADLLTLRDWIDGGCAGDLPEPDAHPVQVTTAEELDALPVGSVVLDHDREVRAYIARNQTEPAQWWHVGEASTFPRGNLMLPATVLYRPEVMT